MSAFLFGDTRIARAIGGKGSFGHTFGGPSDRMGTSRSECCGLHIHLLHRLDLTDPAVPIALPGLRWLPIYYCFDFRVNSLGYRLLSDDSLVTYFPTDDQNVSAEESWPDDDFTMEFPRSELIVSPFPYDPTDLDDAYAWSGIFGVGKLSPRDLAVARQRVADLADSMGFNSPETDEEFENAFHAPFPQGKPNKTCLNPECVNHRRKGALTVVALITNEPLPGVHIFGQYGGGVLLIVEHCPDCGAFRVGHQSD